MYRTYTNFFRTPNGYIPKLLLVMKLTTIILLISLVQVSAASFGQNVTLKKESISIDKVLREIQKQTGFGLVIKKENFDRAKKIKVAFENTPLAEVMKKVLDGTEMTYVIEDNTIIVTPEEKSFFERVVKRWQNIDVTGRIVDENGKPLAGATIKVKGKTNSTITNTFGIFILENIDENDMIFISFIGYQTKEVKAEKYIGEIRMNLVKSDLEEVTISTGYFESTKAKSTMNITKIAGKELENQPVTSLMNALVGRVPGLDITPQNNLNGRASAIEIRGNNSLTSFGSTPLFVVDGIQVESTPLAGPYGLIQGGYDPLAGIGPANIESIEVLKDASATAIYGSRGANGVIRITTKKAKAGQDGTRFNANVYQGIGEIANRVKLMNRDQYLSMRREAFENANLTPAEYDFDLSGIWDNTRETDWQETLLGGTANISDMQAAFSGGNDRTSFRIGGGYHRETTVYPYDDSNFQRANADLSFNHISVNKKLEISGAINLGFTKDKSFASGQLANLVLTLPPVAPRLFNDDGSLNWQEYGLPAQNSWTNPLAELQTSNDVSSHNILSSATIGYNINSGLKLKTFVSYSQIGNNDVVKIPSTSQAPSQLSWFSPSATFVDNSKTSIMIEPQIVYGKSINNHSFRTLLGLTYNQSRTINKVVEGSGYTNDVFLSTIRAANTVNHLVDVNNQYKYVSAYLHLGYDFAGKYIVDITARRDGSSRFGPDTRYGNFGAIGAGWIFSQEPLLKENVKWLSFGKIRGSYGITGNDQIGDYRYLDTYRILTLGYQGGVSLVPQRLLNRDFAWEVTKKLETSLELGFIKNKILLDVSWYRNLSSNQLIDYPLSEVTGFPSVFQNFSAATIENTGWEFNLTAKNIVKTNFSWTTTFNLSTPRNKLLRFDGIENSFYSSRWKVGKPLSILRLYKYTGIDQNTGLHTLQDVDGNGIYNDNDMQFSEALGRTLYYGLNNSFRYKNFELDFLFQFSNNPIYSNIYINPPGSMSNQSTDMLDRWRSNGDNSKHQKYVPYASFEDYLLYNSDLSVQNASFIRMRTMTLSYQFNNKSMEKLSIRGAKLFIQGQNLFTITKFKGFDPETGNATPPLRIISLGLNLTF